jgi:hypothetical protein
MRFYTISPGLDQINRSVRGTTVFQPPVPPLNWAATSAAATYWLTTLCD